MTDYVLLKDYVCASVKSAARSITVLPMYEEIISLSNAAVREDGLLTLGDAYESCGNGCVQFVQKSSDCGCSLQEEPKPEPCAPCQERKSVEPNCNAPEKLAPRVNPYECLSQAPARISSNGKEVFFSRENVQ